MARWPERGLFIVGTDTNVGKTYVTSLLARQLMEQGRRVGVYKPVASGCAKGGGELFPEDALQLWRSAGSPLSLKDVCPQCFSAPLAPHLAAAEEGREVDAELLFQGLTAWTDHCELVLIEGVGGLLSPLTEELYVADLAHDLPYGVLVVAPDKLGAINQTLQTLIAATTFRDGLDVRGVILNDLQPPEIDDPSRQFNRRELEQRCRPPILARVAWRATEFDRDVDWFALADGG